MIKAVSDALNDHHVALHHSRKIIRISIEALQNQARHGKWSAYTASADTASFILYESDHSYSITTGNFICTSDIPSLEKKLHFINTATDSEITQRFRQLLIPHTFRPTKGSGRGLLDMRRKSGTKLTFTFHENTPIHSFFQLTLTVLRSDPTNHHQ